MTDQTNTVDRMNPGDAAIREERCRLIREDAALRERLRPQIAAEEEALANAEAIGAIEIAKRFAEFEVKQRAADAAQKAFNDAERARDAVCVPLRAKVAALKSQLHQPSAGFAQRDPRNWKRVPGVEATPGSDTPPGSYWDPNETHPHGPLNPRMLGGRD